MEYVRLVDRALSVLTTLLDSAGLHEMIDSVVDLVADPVIENADHLIGSSPSTVLSLLAVDEKDIGQALIIVEGLDRLLD